MNKEKVVIATVGQRENAEQALESQGVYAWCQAHNLVVLDLFFLDEDIVQRHDKIMLGPLWPDTNLQSQAMNDVQVMNALEIKDKLKASGAAAVFVPRSTERIKNICEVLKRFEIEFYTDWSPDDEENRRKREGRG